ncbi:MULTISPECIES: LacI family DNA-binding transcriptional regulator [unclassified Curtobacterium]|uniref:LacI family DNA-binding transcriptional regulator n=1 Tax=unclassified Curtobacterium TaxID=257496 RepID=UPI0015E8BAF9|nr:MULTISPECIES: substrate-binding domain-containing protein [unclassified Curtobacterium]
MESGLGRSRRRPSMSDVGKAANVSAQTVSRFYTGGYVSSDARHRIESAVAELGYQHSRLPQILRYQRTNAIGFLNMGPLNFGNAGILTGISHAARAAGQALLTSQVDLDPDTPGARKEIERTLRNLTSMRVDGLVIGTPYVGVEDLIEQISGTVPVVSLSEAPVPATRTVHADSYGGARLAVRHLIDLGHRRILHLAGPGNRNEAAARIAGYRDELCVARIDALEPYRCREWDADSGAEAGRAADPSTFTAVFAANDEIALGFMAELRTRGMHAPADYSIVGIDDMPEAKYFSPPLTTSRLDFVQLGETAMRVILDRVNETESEVTTLIPAQLMVRESTGSPR